MAKGRPRFARSSGRVYTPAATVLAEGAVAAQVRQQYTGRPLLGAVRVSVVLVLVPPSSWSKWRRKAALAGLQHPVGRPDIDNLVKLAIDACNEILWADDAQIVRLECQKCYGPQPMTLINVHEIEHVTERPT